MKNNRASIAFTAFRVMFYVALEQYQPDGKRLIHDEMAREMLPGRLKLLLNIFRFKPLRQGFLLLMEKGFPGVRGGLCRKCYINDRLIEAVDSGFDTVVILGSGLDTRAYNIPQLSSLPVYEVDLPQTITYKKNKLRELYGAVPAHVRLVPMDFDKQVLEKALKGYGYSTDQKSFYIWEGVMQYISEPAVRTVFKFLAKVKPGSRIVFTYITRDFIDGGNLHGLDRLSKQTRSMWHFGLQPTQIDPFIEEYGWKVIEQVGAEEYRQRYLKPLGRTESVMEIERAVVAERKATISTENSK